LVLRGRAAAGAHELQERPEFGVARELLDYGLELSGRAAGLERVEITAGGAAMARLRAGAFARGSRGN